MSSGTKSSFSHQVVPPQGDGFLYGYSLFLQKRDPTSKRGYMQVRTWSKNSFSCALTQKLKRSVVILTHLAFPSLFTATVTKLGAYYFSHGLTMLETACHNIANW